MVCYGSTPTHYSMYNVYLINTAACRAGKNCPCVKTDEYNTSWVIQPCEHSQTKDCPNEAEGKARWSCSVINDECTLVPDVPDFSDCTSQEIRIINATVFVPSISCPFHHVSLNHLGFRSWTTRLICIPCGSS